MCGIIGVYGDKKTSLTIQKGLFAVQHRGQDFYGLTCTNGENYSPMDNAIKKVGLVDIATPIILDGHAGIGHVRYSTQGHNNEKNAQPHSAKIYENLIWLASNGDVTNAKALRKELIENGIPIETENDAEIIVKFIAWHYTKTNDLITAIHQAMEKIHGAFSAVLLTKDALYAFRDLYGFRPLEMGIRPDGAVMFASETVALDVCDFIFEKELAPGEIIKINQNGIKYFPFLNNSNPLSQCHFELVYFSHPDAMVFGIPVKLFRRKLGEGLARLNLEQSQKITQGNNMYRNCFVAPIPDSSNAIAQGFANYPICPLPFELMITRSHYVGRTFIQPGILRDLDVDLKFTFNPYLYRGKIVILIDDTIVRGNTVKKIVSRTREICQVDEVHIRISDPPIRYACHFGIDLHEKEKKELIASIMGVEEICQFIGANSLIYNTIENLQATIRECGGNPQDFCYACLNGEYKCPLPDYQEAT